MLDALQRGVAERQLKEQHEFSSIHALKDSEKIAKLSAPNADPYKIAKYDSPYDGLAAAYHKWTLIAAKAEKLSPEQKQAVAKGFYQKMLVPLYGALKRDPVSSELWMKEAWDKDGALNYKIENAFGGLSGLRHGISALSEDVANLGATGVNLLGYTLKKGWAGTLVEDAAGSNWLDHSVAAQDNKASLFEKAARTTSEIPVLGKMASYMQRHGQQEQFWNETTPNQGFMNKATSLVTEYAPQLGLFKVLGAINEAGIAYSGLTEALSNVKGGTLVAKALMAGTENLAYGALTRPQDDKKAALQDGMYGFALTMLLSSIGKAGTPLAQKLISSGAMQRVGTKATEALERFKTNTREATAAEYDTEFKKHAANTMSVAGTASMEAQDEQGLRLALDWEKRGLSQQQIRNERAKLLRQDKVLHSGPLATATKVQKLTKGQKLSEVVADEKRMALLRTQLGAIRTDAAKEMGQHVEGLGEKTAIDAAAKAKEPGAQPARSLIKAQLVKDSKVAAAIQAGQLKPEVVEKLVDQAYGKKVAAAAKMASEKATRARNAVVDAQAVGKKRTALRARTTETQGETRRAFVGPEGFNSQSIDRIFKNYTEGLKPAFKEAKKGGYEQSFDDFIKEHFEGMEDHDYGEFLHEFLPPQLKEAGLFFEKAQHGENPNLMGFMRNYKDMLPKAVAHTLDDRIMETVKTALSMPKNHVMTESQLQFYSRVLYNHVDNFIGSGRLERGERNIFKSSSPKMTGSTKWMDESLVERQFQDQKLIKGMFSKHPEQQAQALQTLNAMYQDVFKAHKAQFEGKADPAKALAFKRKSDELADWLISQSELKQSRQRLEKWNFDFERGGGF